MSDYQVIHEYLTPKVVPQRVSLKISNPDLQGLQEFCLKHLEWPEEYTRNKVLLLITYWQMTSSLQHCTTTLVQPERIVKARIQQKIECYEVEWQNVQLGETCPTCFVTIETRELFAKVYPELVEDFNNREAAKLSKKSKKKQAAKLPSVSDDYENEVEFLSRQLEDLSVYQSSEQIHSSMAQNENHCAADGILDISNDDSLQDIIDSILPSNSNSYSSYDTGKSSPARMNDVKRKFPTATIGNQKSDDDDDDDDVCTDDEEDEEKEEGGVGDDNDNYRDDFDIHWDFEPLQREVQGYSLLDDNKPEINEKSKTLHVAPSSVKSAEANPDLKYVFECIDTDDNYNHDTLNMETKNDEPVEWPLTSLERKMLEESLVKPIPCTECQSIVKSRDSCKGHKNKPTKTQRQNEKPSKSKLSDADLIEIFGSSDEEGDGKSFMMKQSPCSTKLEDGTKTCDTRLGGTVARNKLHDVFDSSETVAFHHIPLQHAKMGFPCTNALTENGKEVMTNGKRCLESNFQGVPCVKSNVSSSIENTNFEKSAKGIKEEQPKAVRKVLEPANTTINNAFQHSMQAFDSHKKENCDSVDDICSLHESSGKFQYESCKENTASPFEDCMPAPLSKRLGKQFRAKQRLAILHSISSVTDDL